jgi:hypothetical protein
MVQQVMSSESSPVLSGAIPAFEMFMTRWEEVGNLFEETKAWVEVGLTWAKTYYNRMDCTQAYIVAMRELRHFISASM